jgi:hypothetical protein
MVYAFALVVLQGGPLELAALAPYAPAIATAVASAVTGTATLFAARRTGRGSREASTLAKKHEAIEAINAALSNVSESFDELLNTPPDRATVRTAGERVGRALKKLDRTWIKHSYLFAGTKTAVLVSTTIDTFNHEYHEVSGVMLIGSARSPHYDKDLGEARDWLDHYKRRRQVELNDYFSRETRSVRRRTLVPKWISAKQLDGFRSRLELESGYSAKGGHHNA